jgi:hypothetical protein
VLCCVREFDRLTPPSLYNCTQKPMSKRFTNGINPLLKVLSAITSASGVNNAPTQRFGVPGCSRSHEYLARGRNLRHHWLS